MFYAQVRNGYINLGTDYNRNQVKKWCRENEGARVELKPVLPESRKMRGYLEGGLIALAAFYQQGMDHRNHRDVASMRNWLKAEFNSDYVNIQGKSHLVARSTKGRENLKQFTEKVLDWLMENYAPPREAVDPKCYKKWRDEIFPSGGPDNYIDYLVERKLLTKQPNYETNTKTN